MTVFLGTLWSSIKQIKAPYEFDGEYGIAGHARKGKWASSPGEGEVSYIFSSCGVNLGYNLELQRGWLFKIRVCSPTSGFLCSYKGRLRNLHEACQGNRDDSRGEAGDRGSLSSFHSDIGIPVNLQEASGVVTF